MRNDLDPRLSGRFVPIRTVDAIDAEIAELELAWAGNAAADDDVATRIDSDEFDAGIVRVIPRGRSGRFQDRSSTLNASTYITAARKQRAGYREERRAMVARREELRAERRLWSDQTPLGMLEIASMLGYDASAVRQWKRRDVLPAPAGYVSGTPYWMRAAILAWAIERGRDRMIVDRETHDDTDSEALEVAW